MQWGTLAYQNGYEMPPVVLVLLTLTHCSTCSTSPWTSDFINQVLHYALRSIHCKTRFSRMWETFAIMPYILNYNTRFSRIKYQYSTYIIWTILPMQCLFQISEVLFGSIWLPTILLKMRTIRDFMHNKS